MSKLMTFPRRSVKSGGWARDYLDRKSAYFCQLARLGIDDVTMQIDILWYKRVGTDGINRISYRILCVVEALQPMV